MSNQFQKLCITSEFRVYDSENDLPELEKQLVAEAKKAFENAYAPYSDFFVGAAVLLDNGKIVAGNNQENAAYPSGLCAERVALFYAGANYPNVAIKAVAVYCKTKDTPSPCGACRQALSEYEIRYKKPIKVIMASSVGKITISESIAGLLPLAFNHNHLK